MIRTTPAALLLIFLLLAAPPSLILAQDGPDEPVLVEDDPDALTPEEAATLALVDEIAKEVEDFRGLTFKEEFKRKVISPEEIRKLGIEMSEEELPPDLLANTTRLWARLGFFDPETDILECLLKFLEAGALGMYDDRTKTLYLLRGFSPEGARPVIFHELVHALEDQHIGLSILKESALLDSDRGSAVQAVLEGSASYFTSLYMKKYTELEAAIMADSM
jgi:hypothetical protein